MIFYDLLFEDAAILAVNKRSGIPSHSLAKDHEATSPQTVQAQVQLRWPEAQILHRLDTGTSGVLLFAKNDNIFAEMRNKFKLKVLKKNYVAWSTAPAGSLKLPHVVDLSLGHHPKSAKRMVVLDPERPTRIRGKAFAALTRIHGVSPVDMDGLALTQLQVEIETGVTHQIRAHLKYLGYPLIGDAIYNRDPSGEPSPYRLGLHAESVEFSLAGLQYHIVAPLPKSLLIERQPEA